VHKGGVALSFTAEDDRTWADGTARSDASTWAGPEARPQSVTPGPQAAAKPGALGALPSFEEIYEEHFDFVWRSVRRLGVPPSSIDDAAQDVFVVVHDRLAAFEGRSSLKTWIFGIVVHVARGHRRAGLRRAAEDADPDALATGASGPHERALAAEAARILYSALDELSEEKREVFVLMELEEMTAPDVALALGWKLNTVYSRLRHAREELEAAVARRTARDEWRSR
jgi:RNA polymerase sigma-70 factor (ECF subfamily)